MYIFIFQFYLTVLLNQIIFYVVVAAPLCFFVERIETLVHWDMVKFSVHLFLSLTKKEVFSTASGALVVGGVRDTYKYVVVSNPGDSFESSME